MNRLQLLTRLIFALSAGCKPHNVHALQHRLQHKCINLAVSRSDNIIISNKLLINKLHSGSCLINILA